MDGTYAGDPLLMLVRLLKREPQERTEEEIDMLVHFFEKYQIMTEDALQICAGDKERVQ